MNASEREGTKTEIFSCSALQGRMQCTAGADALHCKGGCTALQGRMHCTAGKGYIMADERPILWHTARQAEVW